ncbi:uncharacterized protein [Diadema setosum]|uniref:uncharacterized protein n=1 Tax=Diadema setosum TaxID=31175 RepID=UPI003B3A10A9
MPSVRVCLLVFLTTFVIDRSAALSCPCWWPEYDEETFCEYQGDPECPQGSQVTYDVCGCCKVCTPVVGESCAGAWMIFGDCSEGLVCYRIYDGEPINFEAEMYPNYPEGVCDEPRPIRVENSSKPTSTENATSPPSSVSEHTTTASSPVMTTGVDSREERRERRRQERRERKERRQERRERKNKEQGDVVNDLQVFLNE